VAAATGQAGAVGRAVRDCSHTKRHLIPRKHAKELPSPLVAATETPTTHATR